jgi:putative heme-binding domain-containing protein
MRMSVIAARAILVTAIACGLSLRAAAQEPPVSVPVPSDARNPYTGDAKALTQGAVLFREDCIFCHGVGGRGGMRGPDLTTGSWNHGGSDADLYNTIRTGVPGTAMPPNNLLEQEIWQVVTYLRTIQQPAAPTATGDRQHGETLFFGSLRCSTCHIVNGKGGGFGPELSTVGSARSRTYLVDSIRRPAAQLTPNRINGDSISVKYDTVTAVTSDGRTIVGVPMNEDTFTVQMMDSSEHVYSFDKKSLKSFKHEDRSLMPAYDTARLNDGDLNDLVAYLQSLRSVVQKKGDGRENR